MSLDAGAGYVVGAYEIPDRTIAGCELLDVFENAARGAILDSGLAPGLLDGLFVSNLPGITPALTLAEHLGPEPRWCDTTRIGGAGPLAQVLHAVTAIRAGRCRAALVVYGSLSRSRKVPIGTGAALSEAPDEREEVYGPTTVGRYAMFARRHMHEYGTTPDELAEPAVAASKWAQLNPTAVRQDLLTTSQVLRARLIADPLTAPMCCVITDGGAAVIVTDEAIARDTSAPVRILGAGEHVAHRDTTSALRFTESAVGPAAAAAFAQAGVAPADLHLCTVYDSFTITVLTALEDAGFCAKGEGGAFVREVGLGPGGGLPVNPDGGGLVTNHPGMRGLFLIVELVAQLRGRAGARQVPGARLGAAIGVGGTLDSRHGSATLVMAAS